MLVIMQIRNLIYVVVALIFSVVPSIASAAAINSIQDLASEIIKIINYVIPILIAVALVYFIWGMVKYIRDAGQEAKREEGRAVMIHGIIALFMMIAVWGIVNLLLSTFGLEGSALNQPPVPQFEAN